jgi:hypothetical protein
LIPSTPAITMSFKTAIFAVLVLSAVAMAQNGTGSGSGSGSGSGEPGTTNMPTAQPYYFSFFTYAPFSPLQDPCVNVSGNRDTFFICAASMANNYCRCPNCVDEFALDFNTYTPLMPCIMPCMAHFLINYPMFSSGVLAQGIYIPCHTHRYNIFLVLHGFEPMFRMVTDVNEPFVLPSRGPSPWAIGLIVAGAAVVAAAVIVVVRRRRAASVVKFEPLTVESD